MSQANLSGSFRLETVSWKSYHNLKKKAMEQEFSWSGLVISLSIAFLIVAATSEGLRLVYDSIQNAESNGFIHNLLATLKR